MTDINILICDIGERHEDCIPEYFIPLSEQNLKQVGHKILSDIVQDSEEPSSGDYYLFVLIPGKPVLLDWSRDCRHGHRFW